tara:strand:- start:105 stop:266 length:162 start_codon:yes stop_codon:yes gene_type:complete
MLEVGTLVKYNADGDIGLITEIIEDAVLCHIYRVKWGDGTEGDHLPHEFEVLS